MNAASLFVACLETEGVEYVFAVPGEENLSLLESLRTSSIRVIVTRHEQAAAIAAEGYYRASNRIAAVVVTTVPGGTNTLTGIIGQWLDSIPCIYISGQLKRECMISVCPELHLRQFGDQEINSVDIVRPETKYAVTVMEPENIKYHLEKAYYLAIHGRPGPVWLDIPLDVQSSMIEQTKLV